MHAWRGDLRTAVRYLARDPRFTAVSVTMLALVMGANAALFGLGDALFFKPRPGITAPDRLVDIGRTQDGAGFDTFSYPNYRDFRDGSRSFTGMLAYDAEPRSMSLGGDEGAERVFGTVVSGNFFDVLGTQPAWGRFFTPEEDGAPGAHPVVVISHRLWQERFAGDPARLLRPVRINRVDCTVVGVAPPGFHGPVIMAPDVWAPLAMAPRLLSDPERLESRGGAWLIGIGRLRDGATRASAQAELTLLATRLEAAWPDANRGKGVRVLPSRRLPGDMQGIAMGFVAVLVVLAGLALLVASLNVAGLILARVLARRREFAIRRALGAGAARVASQVLVETLLVFLLGGAAGILLSLWITDLLIALLPGLPVPVVIDLAPDARVLAVSMLVPLGAGLLAGLIPTRHACRIEPLVTLKGDDPFAGRASSRSRNLFVAAQVAVSLVLLVGAGLLARSLGRASTIDPGFRIDQVRIASLDLSIAGYGRETGLRLVDDLLARVRALPGVVAAATAADLPLDGTGLGLGPVALPGEEPAAAEGRGETDANIVSPGYFRALGIPLVEGREFEATDREGAPRVVVVNRTAAARLWPGASAIGRRLLLDGAPLEVIGVAADGKYRSMGEPPRPFLYVPLQQEYFPRVSIVLRLSGDGRTAPDLRALVRSIDPDLPVFDTESMAQYTAAGLFPLRLAAAVAGALGLFTLALAAVGIFGVISGRVVQRYREIGVRMALGASGRMVQRMVVRDGLRLALPGLAAGVLASLGLAPLFTDLLIGVAPFDPATFAGVVLVLALAAVAACFLPARRAARLDPSILLRSE